MLSNTLRLELELIASITAAADEAAAAADEVVLNLKIELFTAEESEYGLLPHCITETGAEPPGNPQALRPEPGREIVGRRVPY